MSNKRKLSTSQMRRLSSYAGMHITQGQTGWIADGEPTLAALLTTSPGLLHDLCDDCADMLVTGGWVRRTPTATSRSCTWTAWSTTAWASRPRTGTDHGQDQGQSR